MEVVGGTCQIYLAGSSVGESQNLKLKGSISISGLNQITETVVGLDRVHGKRVTPAVPSITATLTDTKDATLNFNVLQAFGNNTPDDPGGTVTVHSNSGKTWQLTGAGVEGAVDKNPENGEVTITFTGSKVTELAR